MTIWEQCRERRELRKLGKIRKPVKRQADQPVQNDITTRGGLYSGLSIALKSIASDLGGGKMPDQMYFAEPSRPRKTPKKPVNPFLMQAPRGLQ